MNDHGKSDKWVVPTKLLNKDNGGQAASVPGEPGAREAERARSAEAVEGSRLAKGNSLQRPRLRTQGRVGMSPEWSEYGKQPSRIGRWGNGRDDEISRNREGHFVVCFTQNHIPSGA